MPTAHDQTEFLTVIHSLVTLGHAHHDNLMALVAADRQLSLEAQNSTFEASAAVLNTCTYVIRKLTEENAEIEDRLEKLLAKLEAQIKNQ